LKSLRRWLSGAISDRTTTREVLHGLPVTVHNTRPDISTAEVLRRLDGALTLIERHAPHHFRKLRGDFKAIRVQRYACRGAYFYAERACLVELTFLVNPAFSEAQIAATILHEAMHARLHQLGFPPDMADRARQERFCRRAEIEFGAVVPGGAPIVARALATLDAQDDEVAPAIDEALAARRVAEADREALDRLRR
jgi:HEXXH motif-containing protein